jgi:hypothetical protein
MQNPDTMTSLFDNLKAEATKLVMGGGKKKKSSKKASKKSSKKASPSSSATWHSTGRKVRLANGTEKTVWVNSETRERRVRKMVHRNGQVVASYVRYN